MNNDELKKKIVEILEEGYTPIEYDDGDWGQTYFPTNEDVADALIAAGIGDVKDLKVQVDSLEITNIALQAGYDDAEKDRLYWVDKYKEAEHRAEVAEKAGRIIQRDMARVFDVSNPRICELIANIWDLAKKQAEKELAEEKR